jgi:hypothetical protein
MMTLAALTIVLAVALALLRVGRRAQPLARRQTQLLTYAATVIRSAGAGLPPPGATLTGRVTYSTDPVASTAVACGPGCAGYEFGSPFEFAVHFGTTEVSLSPVDLGVHDNAPLFDLAGVPLDALTLGASGHGSSYLLYLLGPAASLGGAGIPGPAVIGSFWQSAWLVIQEGSQTLLRASVTSVAVSALPGPPALPGRVQSPPEKPTAQPPFRNRSRSGAKFAYSGSSAPPSARASLPIVPASSCGCVTPSQS